MDVQLFNWISDRIVDHTNRNLHVDLIVKEEKNYDHTKNVTEKETVTSKIIVVSKKLISRN